MSPASPPAPDPATVELAAEANRLAAAIATAASAHADGRPQDLYDLAERVAALCARARVTPPDRELAHRVVGLIEDLERLVATTEASRDEIRRRLHDGIRLRTAARAYVTPPERSR